MQFNLKKILRWMAAITAGMLLIVTVVRAESFSGAPDIHPELTAAIEAMQQGQGGENRPPLEMNLSQIGFVALPPGETSDVWAHGNFAYVGGFGGGTTVKVVDISDPTNPQVVKELAAPNADCSPQDVKVETINTKHFHGDLLVVGNDGCFTGVQLYDVSDPTNPTLLSESGPGFVHNTYLYQRGNRAYVLLAVPFAEVFDGFGDFVVMDITDPTDPQIIADWGAGKDGGIAFGSPIFPVPPFPPGSDCTPPPGTPELCRGDSFPGVLLHDVWASTNGGTAYLSYWDAGLILLDISDPTNPTFLGRGEEPPTFGNDEGNAHVAVPAQGGNLVLVGDEDFVPGPWGFLRVFDTSDATDPHEIGAFATSGSLGSDPTPATMHNIIVRGSRAYLSWYFEGIRVVDFSQPSAPREIAAFIPDPAETSPGLFWGVYVHKDMILGSDILGGLFILKMNN